MGNLTQEQKAWIIGGCIAGVVLIVIVALFTGNINIVERIIDIFDGRGTTPIETTVTPPIDATTPGITTPEATTPEETTPEITTPEVTTPEVTTPEVTTPAQPTPEKIYCVNFDANGGSGTMSSAIYTVDKIEKLAKNQFTKKGYDFAGWELESNGTTVRFADEQYIKNIGAQDDIITLKAVWTPHTYKITYHPNGGIYKTGVNYPTEYNIESNVTIPEIEYAIHPETNLFLGWYEDSALTIPFRGDLLTNPRDIDLYAKWETTIFATIETIPTEATDESVTINLAQELDTNFLNHTARKVNNSKYNTITITNTVRELVLIGDIEKTFTNLCLELVGFADGQELSIYLQDFNFVTNENSAIKLTDCGNIKLTIVAEGKSSITTSVLGGNVIDIGTSNLEISGTGNLRIAAGNGANGNEGSNGEDGGIAIAANTVTIGQNVSCDVIGGNGGNGGNGTSYSKASGTYYYAGWYQYNSSYSKDDAHLGYEYRGYNGSNGGNGGNGGNAGVAIKANSINILTEKTVNIVGGKGGNGGDGGNGGEGADGATGNGAAEYRQNVQNGGKGGDGGRGGNGGNGGLGANATSCGVQSATNCTLTNGQQGDGGNGGNGGNGGWGGELRGTQGTLNVGWGAQSATANGGNRGSGGTGGVGGTGLNNGSNGGNGGDGYGGSGGVNYWTKANGEVKATYYGLPGN